MIQMSENSVLNTLVYACVQQVKIGSQAVLLMLSALCTAVGRGRILEVGR